MANLKNELKSRQASLRRLYDDLRDSSFARQDWNAAVRARRTLGSDETIEHGGDDSLLASDNVTVVPGHLADRARPIVLAVTKGWGGKVPHSFARVMRQVKARLIEAKGTIQVVVVFCDRWGSASFQQEHDEELSAHDSNGVRFLFVLVAVPDRVLVPVPMEFSG
jgi:hypothetical protein